MICYYSTIRKEPIFRLIIFYPTISPKLILLKNNYQTLNRLFFLLSLLKYSIRNPQNGMQLLQSKYQIWQDSKNKHFSYGNKKMELDKVMRVLFPTTHYPFYEDKENLLKLQNYLRSFFDKLKNESYPSNAKPYPIDYKLDNTSGFLLYLLCKITRPEKIVETGVAYGLSSAYILQALEENNSGFLYSIDSTFRPWESKQMIGSGIPNHLRGRWKLIFGTSTQKLKKALNSLGSVDIFFHDSLHTYANMIFEFNNAWPFIKKEGFLISDDISSNNAFHEFCSKLNLDPIVLSQKDYEDSFLGILRKP